MRLLVTITILIFFPFYLLAESLNLSQALEKMRSSALEYAEYENIEMQKQEKAKSISGAFQAKIEMENSALENEDLPQGSRFEKNRSWQHSLSLSQLTPWGGAYQLQLKHSKNELYFESFRALSPQELAQLPPTETAILQMQQILRDPNFIAPINPEYKSELSLNIRIPLWRNESREIELKQRMASALAPMERLKLQITQQNILHGIEMLFIQFSSLKSKRMTVTSMKQWAKKFTQLMIKREKFGRADRLDVADAQAKLIDWEGKLLSIDIAMEEILEEIKFRTLNQFKNLQVQELPLRQSIYRAVKDTGVLNKNLLKKIFDVSLQSRLDFKLMSLSKKPLQWQKELTVEEHSFQFDLFAQASYAGLKDRAESSFKDADKPRSLVGVSFSKTLGSSGYRSQMAENSFATAAIESKIALWKQTQMRELQMQLLTYDAQIRKLAQAANHIVSIRSLLKEERKKIRQARSDEVATIRYEMDLLSSKLNQLEAETAMRTAESKLNLLLHKY